MGAIGHPGSRHMRVCTGDTACCQIAATLQHDPGAARVSGRMKTKRTERLRRVRGGPTAGQGAPAQRQYLKSRGGLVQGVGGTAIAPSARDLVEKRRCAPQVRWTWLLEIDLPVWSRRVAARGRRALETSSMHRCAFHYAIWQLAVRARASELQRCLHRHRHRESLRPDCCGRAPNRPCPLLRG